MLTLTVFIIFVLFLASNWNPKSECNSKVLVNLFFVNVVVTNVVFRWAFSLLSILVFCSVLSGAIWSYGPKDPPHESVKVARRIIGNIVARIGTMAMLGLTISTNHIGDGWLTWTFAQMYAIVASSGPLIELWSAVEEEPISYSSNWHEMELEYCKFSRLLRAGFQISLGVLTY
jgi:hypothetical protein